MIRNVRHDDGDLEPRPAIDRWPEVERVPNETSASLPRMARWREVLFRILLRADGRSAAAYGIPPEKVYHVDVPIER